METAPGKYTEKEFLESAVQDGDTGFLHGSWLVKQAEGNGILPRRQDLPHGALWDQQRENLCLTRVGVEYVRLIAISYCWLTSLHPDPKGQHLQTIAATIKHFFVRTRLDKHGGCAIFFDWCSLHQRPRTAEEDIIFKRALKNVNFWYAHKYTTVWMLTKNPIGWSECLAYGERGWPFFERSVSEMISQTANLLDLGLLDHSCTTYEAIEKVCTAGRKPPASAEAFALELKSKTFTNNADIDFVVKKYEQTLLEVMGGAKRLLFVSLGWGLGDCRRFIKVLPLCGHLHELFLNGNKIGPPGAEVLGAGLLHCPLLRSIGLAGNNIQAEGAAALATVLPQCKKLAQLILGSNDLQDEGAAVLALCLPQCYSLRALHLGKNDIANKGAAALANVLDQCAKLRLLDMDCNRMGPEGVEALREAKDSLSEIAGAKVVLRVQKERYMSVDEAARIIVGVTKVSLSFKRQKMKLYEEATQVGIPGRLRCRKVQEWVATCAFLNCVLDAMHRQGAQQEKPKERNEMQEYSSASQAVRSAWRFLSYATDARSGIHTPIDQFKDPEFLTVGEIRNVLKSCFFRLSIQELWWILKARDTESEISLDSIRLIVQGFAEEAFYYKAMLFAFEHISGGDLFLFWSSREAVPPVLPASKVFQIFMDLGFIGVTKDKVQNALNSLAPNGKHEFDLECFEQVYFNLCDDQRKEVIRKKKVQGWVAVCSFLNCVLEALHGQGAQQAKPKERNEMQEYSSASQAVRSAWRFLSYATWAGKEETFEYRLWASLGVSTPIDQFKDPDFLTVGEIRNVMSSCLQDMLQPTEMLWILKARDSVNEVSIDSIRSIVQGCTEEDYHDQAVELAFERISREHQWDGIVYGIGHRVFSIFRELELIDDDVTKAQVHNALNSLAQDEKHEFNLERLRQAHLRESEATAFATPEGGIEVPARVEDAETSQDLSQSRRSCFVRLCRALC